MQTSQNPCLPIIVYKKSITFKSFQQFMFCIQYPSKEIQYCFTLLT